MISQDEYEHAIMRLACEKLGYEYTPKLLEKSVEQIGALDALPEELVAFGLAVIESEKLNPWKAELIDALVCSHILQKEHYSDPRKALNDLMVWEAKVATDPRVSSTALQKPKSFDEEPPTADDADEDGLVWGLDAHLTWKRTHWRLIGKFGYQYWLPLWALPLPTVDENS